MQDVIEQPKVGTKDTANEELSYDPWIPRNMRKSGYLTGINESPRQLNEFDSYTRRAYLPRFKITLSITADSIEELDLAPELTLSEAAELAKKFINALPDDIVDADLGPGL